MSICALCGKDIETEKFITRKTSCPKCGGDLHICLNCRFYCETSHNKCLEPKAEFQRTRDKANFCDYFSFAGAKAGGRAEGTKVDVKKAFDDLFRK
ncbi:MAG: hypothetical protein HZB33_02845 [Nitrospirae bacterium]|nr:hypothetical protein [Nitrospirota bacterium]